MTITQKDLTGGEATGSGIYDELMRTSKAHLKEEYEGARITGTDYSNVYIGMLTANLGAATQFVLQSDITNQQVLLIKEQVKQAEKQNELLELQKAQLQLSNDTAQYNLDFLLPKQVLLLDQQIAQLEEDTLLTSAQISEVNAKEQLIGKQEGLLDQQILTEKANTEEPIGGLSKASYDKSISEKALLDQKKVTEEAQTTGTTATVGGLVGQEMLLKEMQKESFERDAEQKAAKMYTDVFATLYATDPDDLNSQPENYGFDGGTSKVVLSKLLEGVGLPPIA